MIDTSCSDHPTRRKETADTSAASTADGTDSPLVPQQHLNTHRWEPGASTDMTGPPVYITDISVGSVGSADHGGKRMQHQPAMPPGSNASDISIRTNGGNRDSNGERHHHHPCIDVSKDMAEATMSTVPLSVTADGNGGEDDKIQAHHASEVFGDKVGNASISVPFTALTHSENLMTKLAECSIRGRLTMINLSQRGLTSNDAHSIKLAMIDNPHLSVLKLAYNGFGDEGATIIASGVKRDYQHHPSLVTIDLGFNCIGNIGCTAFALHAVSGNYTIRTLYLAGNTIGEKGALSLAGSVLSGCGLTSLHLSANKIGENGVGALSRAITDSETRRQSMRSGDYDDRVSTGSPTLKTIEELYLGGTNMGASGCLSISNMLLTNFSIRVLCMSDCGLEDRDIALFSQSMTRNKLVPLETLQLSFNQLTCIGVESLMNAIWGSKTLREIRMDNNRIQDRGAQLAAVVMTSVDLEVLDLGFNSITTIGTKALMRSLAENSSLKSLTLSGNAIDTTASKAVSYALASNTSLEELYVDNCSVVFSAQRHVGAGIVSNCRTRLRTLTGFQLGPIVVTLGLPPAMEQWSNDQVLNFVMLMWKRKQVEDEESRGSRISEGNGNETSANNNTNPQSSNPPKKIGPADPQSVVNAAKNAFESLGDADGTLLRSGDRASSLDSPLVPEGTVMFESNLSQMIGNTQNGEANGVSNLNITDNSIVSNNEQFSNNVNGSNLERRNRNLEWVKAHFIPLNEATRMEFSSSELWKMHEYFFIPSPLPINRPNGVTTEVMQVDSGGCWNSTSAQYEIHNERNSNLGIHQSITTNGGSSSSHGLTKMSSYRALSDALPVMTKSDSASSQASMYSQNSIGRRRNLSLIDGTETPPPASKRARNSKPRIAYYPRIRVKMEALRNQGNQEKSLVLFRQLKYIESMLLQQNNGSCSLGTRTQPPSPSDVEMILLDIL